MKTWGKTEAVFLNQTAPDISTIEIWFEFLLTHTHRYVLDKKKSPNKKPIKMFNITYDNAIMDYGSSLL